MRVRPYILAGGRSSRMGTDKAMLRLGGRTLLGRAVDTLRAIPMLADREGKVTVTVVGERDELEGADRAIADRHPACGPLGGMESALCDLQTNEAEWAFFLPVDMPFLPIGLIGGLLQEWLEASGKGARVCFPVVDGTPQPLVSLLHGSLQPSIVEAITAGRLKVTPVLESAARVMASFKAESLGYGHSALHTTDTAQSSLVSSVAGWSLAGDRQDMKRLWFSNINREEDFRAAETFIVASGSQ